MKFFKTIPVCILLSFTCSAQQLALSKNKVTVYAIFAADDSPLTKKAATVLQDYFYRVTGALLPFSDNQKGPRFVIRTMSKATPQLGNEGFAITTSQDNIGITGQGRGVIYGVYEFIEHFMGCRKWDGKKAFTPRNPNLSIPSLINRKYNPAFSYREVYMPPSFDDEYLDWHRLHRFETAFGLWGHSFFKLVPPQKYYKAHPEYFSLVNGKRVPLQLCLSNAEVLSITIASLEKMMQEKPGALYWSVSANDDIGYCTCDCCRDVDATEGGPQGSLVRFVNRVAAHFPAKLITTLAYGYSAHAPLQIKAAGNVVVMLSSIDAARTLPLEEETTAAAFRKNLLQWQERAGRIFIWDYCTQFTNYLTPFPVQDHLSSDLRLFKKNSVAGIFEQGSADSYSDMAELKTYLAAKLLWNPDTDADSLRNDFLIGYYGQAAVAIGQYLSALQKNVAGSGARLDIYGNPVNDHATYLTPENREGYSQILDRAESAVKNDITALQRIGSLRLSQEYVYLQQLKFYGKDKHGLYQKNEKGIFELRTGVPERLENFSRLSRQSNVRELSEGGMSPGKYLADWQTIIREGPKNNLAAGAEVTFFHPFVSEYPAKKERTLVDETPGYWDFSYNWLCFYNVPLEARIDMHTIRPVSSISLNFLSDPRHWIFAPSSVMIAVSGDGISFHTLPASVYKTVEDFEVIPVSFSFAVNEPVRYIKITAVCPPLPAWRGHPFKKAMIACDEVWVK